MSKLIFYLLILPLSKVPLWITYRLSDLLFLIGYYLVGYRKRVVRSNIDRSFPALSTSEKRKIERDFFRHLCDVIFESIRGFSMSREETIRRFTLKEGHLLDELANRGKNAIIASGHTGNWEMCAIAMAPQIRHITKAIYTPLSDKFLEHAVHENRSRFGMVLIPKNVARQTEFFPENELSLLVMGTDQSPSTRQRPYFMEFLHQDTPVQYGTEYFARKYDLAVLYGAIRKIKRGHYTMTMMKMTDDPNSLPPGSITEWHTRVLEDLIRENPSIWLWTHKRWKRSRQDYAEFTTAEQLAE